MRILHTSDWHLGRLTYSVSRRSDHEAVLEEIYQIARQEKPHLIVHSGDLFETPRPSVDEMQMAQETLRRLSTDVAPTVVIAGNHDSGPLFDLFSGFLGAKSRLHFVGQPRTPKGGGILEFPGEGNEVARLATLPFVHANRLVDALETPLVMRTMAYADRVMKMQAAYAQELKRGYQASKHILLFTAHLFVDGATWAHSERPVHVTETYATRVSSIPNVSYAAFGHIHKPQALPGGIPGRYAGSPLALDFGEERDVKELVIVDAKPGRAAEIRPIPLKAGRPLVTLEGSRLELEATAPAVGEALLRIRLRTQEPQTGLAEWANRVYPRATLLEVSEVLESQARQTLQAATAPPVVESLEEAFLSYLAEAPELAAQAGELQTVFSAALQSLESEQEGFWSDMDALAAALEAV